MSIEPLTAIVRGGRAHAAYGDAYEWAATLVYLSPTKVEVRGWAGPPSVQAHRELTAALRGQGIRVMSFTRWGRKRGKATVNHTVALTPSTTTADTEKRIP